MALWVAKTVANVNLIAAKKNGAVHTRKSVVEYEVPKHTDLQMGTVWSFQTPSAGGMPAILRIYGLHMFCNTCATTLAFAGHLVMVVDELKEYFRNQTRWYF